jgi:hypothetical protein
MGSYNLTSSFTIDGNWGYPINSSEAQDLLTPTQGGVTFSYPETSPIASYSFVPGVYTLAISDEWGQSLVEYFRVISTAPGTPSDLPVYPLILGPASLSCLPTARTPRLGGRDSCFVGRNHIMDGNSLSINAERYYDSRVANKKFSSDGSYDSSGYGPHR